MKERPILFSGEMVRAILAGTKTQTRRVMSPQPGNPGQWGWSPRKGEVIGREDAELFWCPYGVPGDRLWVRETHVQAGTGRVFYRADDGTTAPRWTPAIHMPRALSRIDLEVAVVRVERLQDISEEDAEAEGVSRDLGLPEHHYHDTTGAHVGSTYPDASFVLAFERLWDEINGKRAPWASNPWVWVVSFKRVRP